MLGPTQRQILPLFILATILCILTVHNSISWSNHIAYEEDVRFGFKSPGVTSCDKATTTIQPSSTLMTPTFESRWERAMREAEEMLSSSDLETPSCLRPNTQTSLELVEQVANRRHSKTSSYAAMGMPVLNMGMPKTGSSTLSQFFECIGLNGTHQVFRNGKGDKEWEGICMRDAVNIGLPPLDTCAKDQHFMMQLDTIYPFGMSGNNAGMAQTSKSRDECFFPQLSLLEAFHQEAPNATFVLNFRPMREWIKSMRGWGDMMHRFQLCHLPNMPRGFPENIHNETAMTPVMHHFVCSHILHVRHFVEEFPSHALIELDLYDSNTSAMVMSELFSTVAEEKVNPTCWGHANESKRQQQRRQREKARKEREARRKQKQ